MDSNILEIKNKILNLVLNYSKINFKEKEFIPGVSEVPVSGKVIGALELQNMVEASLDGWLTSGRFNRQFEEKLSKFLGIKCLLTVNSGSSANLIAFSALTSSKLKERAIQKGDEVITVAAGFPTTVNPIIQFGAIPVFVDVKIPTYNINENLVESAITNKTKAIILAHTLGNPFNVKKIKEICEKYNLWLIEDSCDALGSKFNNQNVGTFGDLATLSFYPAHHITMGEGGAVFTNSKKLERIAESFRDWGRDCYCEPGKDNTCNKRFDWKLGDLPFGYDHKYTYSHLGYNMKITDMQAACGLAQLNSLENFISKRKENFKFLYKNLKKLEEFLILPEIEKNSDPSWFGFAISLKKNNQYNRNDLLKYLNNNKVQTRLLFSGNLTKQPYMKNVKFKIHGELTNTDFIMENTFWIGLHPALTVKHLEYVVKVMEIFFKVDTK
jgi:CDP-6-deoxy-D-xylo-4-hexulose-3-dehydrase